jgi:hypothetical protein
MAGTELIRRDLPWHMLALQYVMLPDGTVRAPIDLDDWKFWETWSRLLGWRQVHETFHRGRRISTVFLGMDHDMQATWEWALVAGRPTPIVPDRYLPLIYETMVFPYGRALGTVEDVQLRARTRAEATRNHHAVVRKVAGPGAFVCPDCFAISHNREDVINSYCGACHRFKPAPTPETEGSDDA